MSCPALSFAAAALLAAGPPPKPSLDLPALLAHVREHAPALLAERWRVDEAAGRLAEDELPAVDDPELDFGFGRRWPADDEITHDWSLGISGHFEPSDRREARRTQALADLDAARLGAEDAERRLLAQAAALHLVAVHARERRLVLERDRDLAGQALETVRRRVQAGASSTLDEQLATLSALRAEGEAAAGAAREQELLGELAALTGLGADEVAAPDAPLAWPWQPDEATALATLARRPDLLALDAEVRGAEAEVRVAQASSEPQTGARLAYERDDRDRVLVLGLTLSLPPEGRGDGRRAAAAARASRQRADLAAVRHAAESGVHAALNACARLSAAAGTTPAALAEAERLLLAHLEAGDVALGDVLAARRELLAAGLASLDRQLDLALAGLRASELSGQLLEVVP